MEHALGSGLGNEQVGISGKESVDVDERSDYDLSAHLEALHEERDELVHLDLAVEVLTFERFH